MAYGRWIGARGSGGREGPGELGQSWGYGLEDVAKGRAAWGVRLLSGIEQ
jgi:hypothetical protein